MFQQNLHPLLLFIPPSPEIICTLFSAHFFGKVVNLQFYLGAACSDSPLLFSPFPSTCLIAVWPCWVINQTLRQTYVYTSLLGMYLLGR